MVATRFIQVYLHLLCVGFTQKFVKLFLHTQKAQLGQSILADGKMMRKHFSLRDVNG